MGGRFSGMSMASAVSGRASFSESDRRRAVEASRVDYFPGVRNFGKSEGPLCGSSKIKYSC